MILHAPDGKPHCKRLHDACTVTGGEAVEQLPDEIADPAWKQSLNDLRARTILEQKEAQLDQAIAVGEVRG